MARLNHVAATIPTPPSEPQALGDFRFWESRTEIYGEFFALPWSIHRGAVHPKPQSLVDGRDQRADAAVLFSIARQFGVPLEVLQKALMRDSSGKPSGPLGAALDAIARMDEERW